ncbi:hypothetical protein, partial [Polaromonas sp.]|uniref:hypothetical protein n=1 Tax=Polaromonas sp. TaxID=1869339 RepID=UPI002FC681AE
GQVPFRAVCGVALLANSRAIGGALRLAPHPEKTPARPQINREQALRFGTNIRAHGRTPAAWS